MIPELAVPHPFPADSRPPDSALARKAYGYVAELSPPFLLNHCVRTFRLAEVAEVGREMISKWRCPTFIDILKRSPFRGASVPRPG